MPLPFVTIAMPCLDEARFIEACLGSVQAQTYPRDRMEILVADGGSSDGTRDILARLAVDDSRIRVIDNPDRVQAAGLNRILAEAHGEVIVRMDVHCEYAPDYIEKCVATLAEAGADDVGGARAAAAGPSSRRRCAPRFAARWAWAAPPTGTRAPRVLWTPSSWAPIAGASSTESEVGTPVPSRTRTPSSTSASSTPAVGST